MNTYIKLITFLIFLHIGCSYAQVQVKYYGSYGIKCGGIITAELINPTLLQGKNDLSGNDTIANCYRLITKNNKIQSFTSLKTCQYSFYDCTESIYTYTLTDRGFYRSGIGNWSWGVDSVFYECDDEGRIIKTQTKDGYYTFLYDGKGNLIEAAKFDNDQNLINGGAKISYKYDAASNVIELAYYDKNNRLYNDGYKAPITKYSYDNQNRLIEESYFNDRLELIDGVAKTKFTYDQNGNVQSKSYFDKSDYPSPMYEDYPNVKEVYTYNDRNKLTQVIYVDRNDQLVNGMTGYAKCEYTYHANGQRNIIKEYSYLDGSQSQLNISKYEPNGGLIEVSNYDSQDSLVELYSDYGMFAIIRHKNDSKGYRIETSYYDKNDALIEGIAIETFGFDKNGNRVESATYDKERNLVENGKHAIVKYKFDTKGHEIEKAYFDKNHMLIEGVAVEESKYDLLGNCIEIRTLDKNHQLISKQSMYDSLLNFAVVKYEFDENSRMTMEAYYDQNNELIDGKAIKRMKYDANGNQIESSCYNRNNELMPMNEFTSVASKISKFDEENRLVEESYFDKDAHLVNVSYYDFVSSWSYAFGEFAVLKFSYDTIMSCSVYNAEGILTKIVRSEDPYFNSPLEVTYYQGDQVVGFDEYGISRYVYTYNSLNYLVREVLYNENLMFLSRIDYTYDGYTNTFKAYFDEFDRPTTGQEGYHKVDLVNTIYYNTKGKVIKTEEYLNSKVDYLKTYGVDQYGEEIYLKIYSKKGKPINGKEGYHYFDFVNYKYYNVKGKEVIYNWESGSYE